MKAIFFAIVVILWCIGLILSVYLSTKKEKETKAAQQEAQKQRLEVETKSFEKFIHSDSYAKILDVVSNIPYDFE